jgi:two-component system NtrC family sensor kinase
LRSKEDIDYVLEDVQELLSESSDGLVRVRDIVQNLKSFARLDEAEVKHVNLNETIESTLKIADNQLKYHCKVVREFGDLPLVHCNAGKLNQVFLNLLVNAGQATSENGVITIGTHVDGDDVIIRIADNGSGILEENLTAIFNPFFTTKPVGEGTGLGLSISYNIIEQHGGQITVKSDTDVGTEFTIRLPIKGVTE